MMRDELVDEARRVAVVCPRDPERHELLRVDSGAGELAELGQLLLAGQAQLESRRAQTEPEEGQDVYCRTAT